MRWALLVGLHAVVWALVLWATSPEGDCTKSGDCPRGHYRAGGDAEVKTLPNATLVTVPAVKVSGIEWTEAMTRTGRDGKAKTIPAGFKLVERTTYGLGTTRATNDKYGRFCDGSGVLPARNKGSKR